jgi:hypothetical protein|nr:MAG TPA: hypothetical protein [Caudoviricetes sp.]
MRKENHPSWLVPFDIAKQLKEIGFNENTLFYRLSGDTDLKLSVADDVSLDYTLTVEDVEQFNYNRRGFYLSIPTWEQVFEWFRAKGFYSYIKKKSFPERYIYYIGCGLTTYSKENLRDELLPKTYEQARKELIEKLIELCKDGDK